MRKLVTIILTAALTVTMAVPVMAATDYSFESGGDTLGGFGKATSVDTPVTSDPLSGNTRRNKDAAHMPPPYGVFSGDIPTDQSSAYHDNLPNSGFAAAAQDFPQIGGEGYAPGVDGVSSMLLPPTSQAISQTTPQATTKNTAPLYYDNGTIGTLHVARTGKTIKVYEGEDLSNLAKGAGHFLSTSSWDGNVALAGHNRSSYFGWLKNAAIGDKLTYTTMYGVRTYEVVSKTKVNEYDNSMLGYSADNILTMFTCVENVPSLRWCVVAKVID